MIYSQEITVDVANVPPPKTPLFVPNQNLSAVINQEAILKLPDFGSNAGYALIGSQTFKVILEGAKLTVFSSNLSEVGTQKLKMSLTKGDQVVNFEVVIVFSVN